MLLSLCVDGFICRVCFEIVLFVPLLVAFSVVYSTSVSLFVFVLLSIDEKLIKDEQHIQFVKFEGSIKKNQH